MKINLKPRLHKIAYVFSLICIITSFSACNKPVETPRQIKDKQWIEQAVIDNIEAERLAEMDSVIIANFDSISRPVDQSGWFSKYATRNLKDSHKYKPYPQHASEQIDATVDKIFYSEDSLKCAASVVLDVHFDILPEFTDPEMKHLYYGFAIFGVRNNIDRPFKIYPITAIDVKGCDYSSVARILNNVYNTKTIRDCGTAGTYMEKRDYKYSFGHKMFFEDSPDFQTDSMGNYWCEYYYLPVTKPYRKYFYSNRDDADFPTDGNADR